MEVLAPPVVGLMFGTAFDLGMVNDPNVIKYQFSFSAFWMLRMFLSAAATSTVAIHSLHLLDKKVRLNYDFTVLANSKEVSRSILGGGLLGMGMYLSGSCPGTVWSQLGSFPDANVGAIIAGGVLGSIVFAKLNDQGSLPTCSIKKRQLKKFEQKIYPYALISALVTTIFVVEHFFPWREQARIFLINSNEIDGQMVDPGLAGIIIGVSQVISYLGTSSGLGSSSGWLYLTGTVTEAVGIKSETLKQASKSKAGRYQAITAMCICLGSFLVQNFYQTDLLRISRASNNTSTINLLSSLAGGFLTIFGARIAGGCTSGHGLTGIANINPLSFVTVAAMFGGGCLLALSSALY